MIRKLQVSPTAHNGLRLCALLPTILLAGCTRAPSVDIIGSFFPGWLICLTIAVLLVFVVRWVLVKFRLESEVGPLALFYPSLVTLLTSALWLLYFR